MSEDQEDKSESKKFKAGSVFNVIPRKDYNEDHETEDAQNAGL